MGKLNRLGAVLAVLCAPLLCSCTPQQQEVRRAPDAADEERPYSIEYTVQRGDTLYGIARAYGTSVESIKRINGIGTMIKPGQRLLVPMSGTAEAPPAAAPAEPAPAPVSSAHPEPGPTQPRPIGPEAPSPAKLNHGRPGARLWWPAEGKSAARASWKTRGAIVLCESGAPVCASASGKVIAVVPAGRAPRAWWGNTVILRHSGGLVTWYSHLRTISVDEGQWVRQGAPIGTAGTTGHAETPRVALRVFNAKWETINPYSLLPPE